MVTHFIAGHDTTGYSLSWILVEVARHQLVQEKVFQELQSIVPADAKHVDLDSLAQLTYLDQVIKEGMRLWPVVGLGSSREASRDIEYNGMIIPKGSILTINFYSLFRDADIKVTTRFGFMIPCIRDLTSS
jgi:cytochrome P450 family 4